MLAALNGGKDLVVVADYSGEVYGNHRLGAGGDGVGHLVVVHLVCARCAVHHHGVCAGVAHGAGGGGISVCGDNHLVAGAYAQHAQGHLHACRCRVETCGGGELLAVGGISVRVAVLRNQELEFLCFRAGGDPPRFQGFANLVKLGLRHVRRRKRYIPFYVHALNHVLSQKSVKRNSLHWSVYGCLSTGNI